MRIVSLLAIVLAFVGCSSPAAQLKETAADINKAAFDGKVDADVHFCKPHALECANHHGLWDPKKNEIHIAWQWEYEPYIYLKGAIAHEMIHAYLGSIGYTSMSASGHDWKFQAERRRVAELIDIPLWAISDGKKRDKLDASREVAELEAWMTRIRYREGCMPASGDWPSTIYDVDDE